MSSHDDKERKLKDLCFIDIETTGTIPGYHEIIDIGAVRTSPDATYQTGNWQRRIRPKYPERMSEQARVVNGYHPRLWEHAEESSGTLWSGFAGLVKGCVPVCHNPSFDRAFITLAAVSFDVWDLGTDYHWIGTESLAWPLYKAGVLPSVSLESLCLFFDVGVEPSPHIGLEGARACWRVYTKLMELQSSRVG
jgi:DNA polymerase-3 subunit alpha (Gram-positive type)